MQNYSYLQPPSEYRSFDHSFYSDASQSGRKKPKFYSTEQNQYTDEEVDSLNRLKQYLKHKNPQKSYPDSLLLRYCHLGSFMTSNSKDSFKFYEDWVSMPPCSRQIQKGILHSGVFYCYGRDDKYCPTIYFHPNRLDLKNFQIQDYLVCLRTLLTPIEQHMLIPGKVEQWNVVIDIRDFVDQKYKDNYEIIYKNVLKICFSYPFRLKRLFLVEKRFSSLWSPSSKSDMVHKIINDLKIDKKCVRIFHLKDFDNYIPIFQRQKLYGGELDDLCEFWPIKTTNRLTELNSQFVQYQEQSCDYGSIDQDNAGFFAQSEQKGPLCDLKKACNIF